MVIDACCPGPGPRRARGVAGMDWAVRPAGQTQVSTLPAGAGYAGVAALPPAACGWRPAPELRSAAQVLGPQVREEAYGTVNVT